MGVLRKLFGGGSATKVAVKGGKGVGCVGCGRTDLKIPQQLSADEDIDVVGRVCPRCRALYCVHCVQKLPKHSDRFGRKCQACGKFTIIELSGKPDFQLDDCAKHSEKLYG